MLSSSSSSSTSYIENWSSSSQSSISSSSSSSSYVINWSSSSNSSSSYIENWSSSSHSSVSSSSSSSSSSSYIQNWSTSSLTTSSSSYVENWSTSSSSSSSSSFLDYSANRTLPFIFEIEEVNPVWTMVSYGEYIYAGTGSSGILLKSFDRYTWSQIAVVDDIHIKSLAAQNDELFIGTSPNGKTYIIDLTNDSISFSQELGGTIYGFLYYNNLMYCAGGTPTQIYSYNTEKLRWDSVYQPYSSVVTKMLIFNNKMYVFLDDQNFVSFDGTTWTLSEVTDNVSSIRSVTKEPFSHTTNDFIIRSNVRTTNNLSNEDIYDIFPMNYAVGLKSADVDGDSLTIGTSNYAKVYNYANNQINLIFQTEALNTVHYILNLDVGTNLASIDNKLYLINCGDLEGTTTTTTILPTTTTTTTSIINMVFPAGGESFVIGDTVTLQWTSDRNITDAVKIELYEFDVLNQVINPSTSNTGTYDWLVPTGLLPSSNYKIILTWLSSQNPTSTTSNLFGILVSQPPTTTTTTTTPINTAIPVTNNCRGIPILDLPDYEYITCMIKDTGNGGILFSTSEGRIFGCRDAVVNAYITGSRDVFAEVKDGFGNVSETAKLSLFYALYNKIAEVNEGKEIERWKYVVKPTAILNDRITGIFLSPILSVKQDLVLWKQLIWNEIKPTNTEIIICIRSADSVSELQALSWDYCFTSTSTDVGNIIRSLQDYQINGKYIQFKVTMTTSSQNVTPSIVNLTLTYSTKFAVYFFTTKFALENNSNVKAGLITGTITEPINTEVQFGIASSNTADWNEYTVVDINKFFSLSNLERVKVGIKMIAYDTNIPVVSEFSLMSGSEILNKMNS